MKHWASILMLMLGLCANSPTFADDPELTFYVNNLAQMLEDNDADLNRAEQKEICLDINGYKPCYQFALFTLTSVGGGNGAWATYLVLFDAAEPASDPLDPNARHKKFQLLDIKKISDDKNGDQFFLKDVETQHSFIILHGKGYNKHDPECCPSKPVTLRFTVDQDLINLPASN